MYELKRLRTNAHYTSKKVATLLGLNAATYCRYENGERRCPDEIIKKLSEIYSVAVDEIIAVPKLKGNFKFGIQNQAVNVEIDLSTDGFGFTPVFKKRLKAYLEEFALLYIIHNSANKDVFLTEENMNDNSFDDILSPTNIF